MSGFFGVQIIGIVLCMEETGNAGKMTIITVILNT